MLDSIQSKANVSYLLHEDSIVHVCKSSFANKLLTLEESERVLRFMRLYAKAFQLFKTNEATIKWFSTVNKALGDKKPIEYARTEPGARLVEDILGRIKEGVFS